VAGTGKGDRWATFNTFVDAVLAQTSEAEVRVWLVLYRDVKPGGLARVGMTDIARRAGLTRRGVVKAINGLKRRRLIEVTARGSINGTPNAYRLLNPGA
jgi:DNA-binding MarR family transcriptional regulator